MRLTLCLLLLGLIAFVMVNAAASQREAENSVSRETRNARKQVDKKTKKGRKLRRNKAGRRNRHPKRKSRKAKKSLKRTRKNGQRRSRPGWRVVKPASAALRATARQNGKLVGAKCSYIIFENILTNGNGCKTGDKFVLKAESGSRRQFLIVSNKIILAFVSNAAGEKKFTDCATITDVTAQLTCKAVDGVADLVVVEGGSSGNGGGAATAAATTSAAATTAAPASFKCGVKKSGTRIIGGQETEVFEYPWMVALGESGSGWLGCGGTLIAAEWVLTAAHCLETPVQSITLGEHDQTSSNDNSKRKVVSVTQTIPHESYAEFANGALRNDVALLKLSEKVDLNTYTPACLPSQGANYAGQTAFAYGWGTTSAGGSISPVLRDIALPVVTNSVCSPAMQNVIEANMICAGGIGGQDACQGDSGGPLTVPDSSTGQHTLIGATSWGDGCAEAGKYGVWANIPFFRNWLDDKINANGGATFKP